MTALGLFDLLSQRNEWLSQRQLAVSQNVANANTPGYRAVDVTPFQSVLQSQQDGLTRTDPAHLAADDRLTPTAIETAGEDDPGNFSGNTVTLEGEMLKAGDIANQFSLNTAVYKTFHRMVLNSAR